jgi:hypothetical protein
MAATRAEALGDHAHYGQILVARQARVGIGASEDAEQLLFVPVARRHLGHDLLGENVERLRRYRDAVELAAPHCVEERRAFHQLVARQREKARLRLPADRVVGAPGPLQESCDRAWRAELADELDIADVDAKLERRRGDERPQPPRFEPLLRVEAPLLGEAPVVRGDDVVADQLRQVPRHAFRHPPGVDEHERRAMLLRERRKSGVDLLPHLARHDRFERRRRNFEGEIALPHMSDIDDRATVGGVGSHQIARDFFDRLLRRRQAHAHWGHGRQRGEALQGQGKMAAALVRGERVDLVRRSPSASSRASCGRTPSPATRTATRAS